MENDNDLLTGAQGTTADAEEDAAFLAEFGASSPDVAVQKERPDEGATEPDVDSEESVEGEGKVGASGGEGGTEESAPTPEPARTFAGLTEEQIAAALARSGTMQSTIDKMAGRMGQMLQQIEALKTSPPTTKAAKVALNLKLEKLSENYPELAEMLRDDLKEIGGGSDEALAEKPPVGVTQEQFDKLLEERVSTTAEKLREEMEIKILSIQHPDWLEVIKTPEFALWRDNVLGGEKGRALMESQDSAFISGGLSAFKNWRAAKDKPAPTPAPARAQRLANAVRPASAGGSQTSTEMSEQDYFLAGFKQEQARQGR